MSDQHLCNYCSNLCTTKTKFCKSCNTTAYCSVSCQRKDFEAHKAVCGKPPAEEAPAVSTPAPPTVSTPAPPAKAASTAGKAPPTKAAVPSPQLNDDDDDEVKSRPMGMEQANVSQNSTQEQPQGSFFTSTTFLAIASTAVAAVGGALYFYFASSNTSPQTATEKPAKKAGKRRK